MFESLQPSPPDPILGLTEAFKQETNPRKINLSVGVYQDSEGRTPILACVKEAERRLLQSETTKSYLAIPGSPEFGRLVQELTFGAGHEIVTGGEPSPCTRRAARARYGLRPFREDFLPRGHRLVQHAHLAQPPGIFEAAGLNVRSYPYFDKVNNRLNLQGILDALQQMPAGDVVCLHSCCHNPSGIDPIPNSGGEIGDSLYGRGLLPLVDFAYQGFGDGFREDAVGLLELCRPGKELLIASSFSKNFGLYRERTGALLAVGATAAAAQVRSRGSKSASAPTTRTRRPTAVPLCPPCWPTRN